MATVTGTAFGDTITTLTASAGVSGPTTASADTVTGLAGNDSVDGGGGNDSLDGGSSNDTLSGADGNDTLDGGTESDSLSGGVGVDRLIGGLGNDTMAGGAGNDTFVVEATTQYQVDTITDFNTAGDRLDISALGVSTFDALIQNFFVSGSDIYLQVYRAGYYTQVYLTGLDIADLDAGDFIFSTANAADSLVGTVSQDTLFGGLGNDTIDLGGSNDRGFGEQGNDSVAGGSSNDLLDGGIGNDTLDGGTESDSLAGGAGTDRLAGGDSNDTIDAGTEADTVDGGLGYDLMTGGAGSDLFVVTVPDNQYQVDTIADFDNAGDLIDVSALGVSTFEALIQNVFDTGGDPYLQVYRAGYYTQVYFTGLEIADLDATDFVFSTANVADSLVGTVYQDTLFGGLGNDTIDLGGSNDRGFGEDGNDSIAGGSSNDLLDGGIGNDTLDGGTENDTLVGGAGADRLFGGDGNDQIDGGSLADLIDAGFGNDAMTGGTGNDTFVMNAGAQYQTDTIADFDTAGDRVDVSALGVSTFDALIQNAFASGADTYLEIYRGGYYTRLYLTGIAAAELDAADFVFSTTNAADSLVGTIYQDTLFGGLGNDTIDLGGSNDRGFGEQGNDSLLGGDGNDLLDGGAGNDVLLAGDGNDTLAGGAGTDTLDGGLGYDTIVSGEGADRIVFAPAFATQTDVVTDFAVGQDRIDVSATGASTFEALSQIIFADTEGVYLFVQLNGYSNRLTLAGLTGADLDAPDFIFSTSTASTVIIGAQSNDTLFAGQGDDTVEANGGTDRVFGEQGKDLLSGGASGDLIDGGAGNDTIAGGTEADTIVGGEGLDTTDYSSSGAGVLIRLWAGTGSGGEANGDLLSSIEAVRGSTFGDTLEGDRINETLDGRGGNDLLQGGRGADVLIGGTGNDSFIGGAGFDTADFSAATTTVRVNLNLTTAQTTVGGELEIFQGIENLIGGTAGDSLLGSNQRNDLAGGGGRDTIRGGSGDDTIRGGASTDELFGGAGVDHFVYGSLNDAPVPAILPGIADLIGDFVSGEDKIDLSAIDADQTTQGNQDFTFIGSLAFSAAGQLRLNGTDLLGSTDADADAEFLIRLQPGATFVATDLIG